MQNYLGLGTCTWLWESSYKYCGHMCIYMYWYILQVMLVAGFISVHVLKIMLVGKHYIHAQTTGIQPLLFSLELTQGLVSASIIHSLLLSCQNHGYQVALIKPGVKSWWVFVKCGVLFLNHSRQKMFGYKFSGFLSLILKPSQKGKIFESKLKCQSNKSVLLVCYMNYTTQTS